MKRIVICADGTWNRPEEDITEDHPTNVLKVARSITPKDDSGNDQVVFYDWGVGSYYKKVTGGAFGDGLNKNIQDCYRFIVQNYELGDELFFFGFSRGAYTVRSLAGLMNNCSILKRAHANRIEQAFDLYKNENVHPRDATSQNFRQKYAVAQEVRIRFVGVWDTVGALGIPIRMLGFLNENNLFYDNKIGPNIDFARHALSIDEQRDDFEPTIWKQRPRLDIKQVWFAGVHSDVGGSYKPDSDGTVLSDNTLQWMIKEVEPLGLKFEPHLSRRLKPNSMASQHEEFKGFYKVLGRHKRTILKHTPIHASVRDRYNADPSYRPEKLEKFVNKYGWFNMED